MRNQKGLRRLQDALAAGVQLGNMGIGVGASGAEILNMLDGGMVGNIGIGNFGIGDAASALQGANAALLAAAQQGGLQLIPAANMAAANVAAAQNAVNNAVNAALQARGMGGFFGPVQQGQGPAQIKAGFALTPGAPGLVQAPDYGRAKGMTIGLDSAETATPSIAPGGSLTISKTMQTLFRGETLSIPDDIALRFVMDQVLVGIKPQLAANGGVPCSGFSHLAPDRAFEMDDCRPGIAITFIVRNISLGASPWRCALKGTGAV